MKNLKQSLGLYVLTDRELSRGRSNEDVVRLAVKGGATCIQFREKVGTTRELYREALKLRHLTALYCIPFIVNDRLDLALAVGADGVHLGQEDLPRAAAREIMGRDKILGISVGSVEEALEAQSGGADYLGVGPIFTTSTKQDAGPGIGLAVLGEIRRAVSLPLVAIGGINVMTAADVLAAGADGLAVISAVVSAERIDNAAEELKKFLER
jgi:thiamine-phosphate pyrophosphorylase